MVVDIEFSQLYRAQEIEEVSMSTMPQERYEREDLVPTQAVLRALAIAMAIQAGFGLLQIGFAGVGFKSVWDSVHGNYYTTHQDVYSFIVTRSILTVLDLLFGLLAIIVYLVAVYRVGVNSEVVVGEKLCVSPGWAVMSYFIPIANLFVPYLSLQEVWKAGKGGSSGWRTRPESSLIRLFWGVLLVERLVFVFSYWMWGERGYENAFILEIIGETLLLLSCFLAWYVLFRCDHQLRAHLGMGETVGESHSSV
jgi:hypothetical protein